MGLYKPHKQVGKSGWLPVCMDKIKHPGDREATYVYYFKRTIQEFFADCMNGDKPQSV